jgi:molecular chaperone HscB
MQCWNCGAREIDGALFCPSCKSLQNPATGYFEFFGLEPKLALDIQALQKRFYELSRQLHPDRYGRRPERERQYSLEATAILNDAWRVLRDPVERAEYVLDRNGYHIAEQRSKDVPPELLEEVFDLNMALEELREGDAEARPHLEEARGRFVSMQGAIDADLERLFEKHDQAPEAEKRGVLAEIRGVLNRRRYIQNLIRDVEKELNVHVSN